MIQVSTEKVKDLRNCFEVRVAAEQKNAFSTMSEKDGLYYTVLQKNIKKFAGASGWQFFNYDLDKQVVATDFDGFSHYTDVYRRFNGGGENTAMVFQNDIYGFFAFADAFVLSEYSKAPLRFFDKFVEKGLIDKLNKWKKLILISVEERI